MPYNESTTKRPDGSKTVRKEHIDPETGKCTKIEITEYPPDKVDFSIMSYSTKQPKTTVIIPDDDNPEESGFSPTTMPTIGKTTVGKTTTKTVHRTEMPSPSKKPITPKDATTTTATNPTAPLNDHDGNTNSTPTSTDKPTASDSSTANSCCCTIQ
mmetsp:Transcript_38537/g.93377  ORF Transcript_38537/g.93377 Transcript_38537/m.93377 type:complete len:156 (+) Transcript_38537:122-589(+)